MKWSRLLILICLCSASHAFAQYEQLLDKSFADRARLLDSILYSASDKTATCTAVINYAEGKSDKKLKHHAQVELLAFQTKKSADANYMANYQELLAKVRSDKLLYIYTLAGYARLLENNHQLIPAFEAKLRAHELYEHVSGTVYPYKNREIFELGRSYYRFENYDNALNCFHSIREQCTDSGFIVNIINLTALIHRERHIWDSAHYYFEVLNKIAEDKQQTSWQLIAQLNTGHTYYKSGDIDKAYSTFLAAYNFAHEHKIEFAISEATATMAAISVKRGNYQQAKSYALEGVSKFQGNNSFFNDANIFDAQKLFESLAQVYYAEGRYKDAYLYMDSLVMVLDSANRRINLPAAANTVEKLLQSKYEQEQQNTLLAKEQKSQMRNALIAGIVLLAIISLLLLNRQRIRRRQLIAERNAAEAKLSAAKMQLEDYTRSLQEKNSLVEKFTQDLEEYKAAEDAERKNKTIHQLEQATILTDDDWDKFKHMFEQVHSGYLHRLKEKLPDLTPGESRFMVLSKLKLSTKEMAGILGVGTSTIRKYKHQVRNKLNLPEDSDLDKIADVI